MSDAGAAEVERVSLFMEGSNAWVNGTRLELTPQLLRALRLLYDQRGKVVPRDVFAERVWPDSAGDVSDETIDQVVTRLRGKLPVDDKARRRALSSLKGRGILLDVDLSPPPSIDLPPPVDVCPVAAPPEPVHATSSPDAPPALTVLARDEAVPAAWRVDAGAHVVIEPASTSPHPSQTDRPPERPQPEQMSVSGGAWPLTPSTPQTVLPPTVFLQLRPWQFLVVVLMAGLLYLVQSAVRTGSETHATPTATPAAVVQAGAGNTPIVSTASASLTPVPDAAVVRVVGGVWVYPPWNAEIDVSHGSVQFQARAYPRGPRDPAVDRVEFTVQWPRTGWTIACVARQPSADDMYGCQWIPNDDGTWPALTHSFSEDVQISFDVYNREGDHNNAPHGIRTIHLTYHAP